ncbi:hypothetical protein D770_08565 [Flammeovirgaceae bacterium 311]|nr:hypothetical protein D770_08565 [Flammeovirgaceae bacterium 311]
MPLQPENNKYYWPLLLTEDLYLLPGEMEQQRQVQASLQAPAPPPAVEEVPLASPPTQAAPASEQKDVTADSPAPQPDLIWGSLKRGVLVVVDYPGHPLIDRPDGLFLVEVLKALGFDFKDVATLNISRCKSAADWAYVKQLSWQHVLVFDASHPELPFTRETGHYELKKWENRNIIQAEKLSSIRSDVAAKKKLWNLLKQLFV